MEVVFTETKRHYFTIPLYLGSGEYNQDLKSPEKNSLWITGGQ
jgi:hypothetical protein